MGEEEYNLDKLRIVHNIAFLSINIYDCFGIFIISKLHSQKKRNIWIFKYGDWNFYSIPGYEILKYFSHKFSKMLLKLRNFFFLIQRYSFNNISNTLIN